MFRILVSAAVAILFVASTVAFGMSAASAVSLEKTGGRQLAGHSAHHDHSPEAQSPHVVLDDVGCTTHPTSCSHHHGQSTGDSCCEMACHAALPWGLLQFSCGLRVASLERDLTEDDATSILAVRLERPPKSVAIG